MEWLSLSKMNWILGSEWTEQFLTLYLFFTLFISSRVAPLVRSEAKSKKVQSVHEHQNNKNQNITYRILRRMKGEKNKKKEEGIEKLVWNERKLTHPIIWHHSLWKANKSRKRNAE